MKAPRSLPLLLALGTTTSSSTSAADPTPPRLTYLLTAHVDAGETITVGPEPGGGTRVVLPIRGGTFTGAPPGPLRGTIAAVGADAGWYAADGATFHPDGLSVLQTADGANILWWVRGAQRGGDIYGAVTFRTGDERYAWLNDVVAISRAGFGASGNVGVDIFVVSWALASPPGL